MQENPYYLGENDGEPDVDDIPIVRLDDAELAAEGTVWSSRVAEQANKTRARTRGGTETD